MRNKILLLILVLMTGSSTKAQVKVIGHRGATYMAPENTIAKN